MVTLCRYKLFTGNSLKGMHIIHIRIVWFPEASVFPSPSSSRGSKGEWELANNIGIDREGTRHRVL
jgi:hypothetical protein